MSDTHHSLVADQYGPRADNYVTSAVHASGEDLDQIEAAVRGMSAARVLDLGCGGGHVSYRIAPHVAEVVAVDLTAEMLQAVERTAAERGLANITVQQSAAERMPFVDGYFDLVLCRFSAHHWHGFEAGLREARRVLAPGGRAVFVDTVAPASALVDTHLQTVELLRDPSHVRNYSTAEWVAALDRARFAVTSIKNRRLRMQFATWIARTGTPPLHAQAIRSLQQNAPADVRAALDISDDGSFLLDAVSIEAEAA